MKRVLIDMDEVIADPMGAMIEWYKKEYNGNFDRTKAIGGSWIKGFPEMHQDMLRKRLFEPGFFRDLPVMQGSIQTLEKMNEKYEIFIVSAATEFPNSLKDKLEWLLEHFPFFSWRQLVLCGDKRMVQGDYMIDDHVRNLVHFKGKPYLFSSPHNANILDYDRINDWDEAARIFLNGDTSSVSKEWPAA